MKVHQKMPSWASSIFCIYPSFVYKINISISTPAGFFLILRKVPQSNLFLAHFRYLNSLYIVVYLLLGRSVMYVKTVRFYKNIDAVLFWLNVCKFNIHFNLFHDFGWFFAQKIVVLMVYSLIILYTLLPYTPVSFAILFTISYLNIMTEFQLKLYKKSFYYSLINLFVSKYLN